MEQDSDVMQGQDINAESNQEPTIESINPLALSLMLQKTNRILVGNEKITVKQDNSARASIACADTATSEIFLAYGSIRYKYAKDLFDFLTLSKGLNYHELSHLLFTSTSSSMIKTFLNKKYKEEVTKKGILLGWVSTSEFYSTLSLLEDCRIENMFFALYPRAKHYFTFCASKIIMDKNTFGSDEQMFSAYLLLYGRKFILYSPEYSQFIQGLRQKYISSPKHNKFTKSEITKMESLLDSFIMEKSVETRLEIAYELHQIFKKQNFSASNTSDTGSLKSRKRKSLHKNTASLLEDLKNIIDKMKKMADKQKKKGSGKKSKDDDIEGEEEGEEGEDDTLEEQLDADDDNDDETQGDSDTQDSEDSDADDKSKQGKDKNNNSGRQDLGDGSEDSDDSDIDTEMLQKQMKDKRLSPHNKLMLVIQKICDDSRKNQTLQNEVLKDATTLSAGNGEFGDYSGELLQLTPQMVSESKKIEQVLEKIRGDLATQQIRFKKKGKVDILSVIKTQKTGGLNIFKQHILNKISNSKMGVCFLIDSSGSVDADEFQKEIKAVYCMSKALEAMHNKVQVLEFSSEFRILKKFNSEGDWHRSYHNGTSVEPSIIEGVNSLKQLRRKENIQNLFLIVISDGCFDENTKIVKEKLSEARKQGISSLWILASSVNDNEEIKDAFDWFFQIRDLSELSLKLNGIISKVQLRVNQTIQQNGGFYR